MKATEEYERLHHEVSQAMDKFYHVVILDDRFAEYMEGLKLSLDKLLEEWYPFCQRAKVKREWWNRYKQHRDLIIEQAEVAWAAYAKMDKTRAFQYQYKFDGRETKKTPYLPPKNCKAYRQELMDAIAFVKSADPCKPDDYEQVKKNFDYHHKAYIYLLTVDAENKIGHKIAEGRWKELRRLSAELERISNLFLNQNKR